MTAGRRPEPGWLARQFRAIKGESRTWPPWLSRGLGPDTANDEESPMQDETATTAHGPALLKAILEGEDRLLAEAAEVWEEVRNLRDEVAMLRALKLPEGGPGAPSTAQQASAWVAVYAALRAAGMDRFSTGRLLSGRETAVAFIGRLAAQAGPVDSR